MVVDDDPAMLFTVTEILEDAGYEVFGIEDGYQAIELASTEVFGLLNSEIAPAINAWRAH